METSVGQKYQYYLHLYCLRVNTKQDIINSWLKKPFQSLHIGTLDYTSPSLSACPSFIIHLFASTAHIHPCSLCFFFFSPLVLALSVCFP